MVPILSGQATGQSGKSGTAALQVRIRNWWNWSMTCCRRFFNWFGVLDRALTNATSAGWLYATDRPAAFADDADRLVWNGQSDEFLEWTADTGEIRRVSVELYTSFETIDSLVALATAVDGTDWRMMPYTVEEVEIAAAGWRKFMLRGEAVEGAAARWFRLTLNEAAEPGSVQIGKVSIVGRLLTE